MEDRREVVERARREELLAEERAKREADNEKQMRLMNEQKMEMMRRQFERRTEGTRVVDSLKLTKLTESEDIESYLKTFERMMEAYEVEEDRWAFKLAPQLTGKSQQAYASLSAHQAAQYPEVKKAILKQYNISEETYRERFRLARMKEGEGYAELNLRLQDLLRRWFEGCDSIDAVCEKVLVEQLLNAMPAELKVWVGERKPTTGEEAARLADDYVQARHRVDRGLPRMSDSRKGRMWAHEGPVSRRFNGGRDTTRESKPDRRKLRCYNCGKEGHIAMQCLSKALFCGGGRGLSTTRTGVVENKKVEDILLDTGCTQTMVRQDLVQEGRLLEGEAMAATTEQELGW